MTPGLQNCPYDSANIVYNHAEGAGRNCCCFQWVHFALDVWPCLATMRLAPMLVLVALAPFTTALKYVYRIVRGKRTRSEETIYHPKLLRSHKRSSPSRNTMQHIPSRPTPQTRILRMDSRSFVPPADQGNQCLPALAEHSHPMSRVMDTHQAGQ